MERVESSKVIRNKYRHRIYLIGFNYLLDRWLLFKFMDLRCRFESGDLKTEIKSSCSLATRMRMCRFEFLLPSCDGIFGDDHSKSLFWEIPQWEFSIFVIQGDSIVHAHRRGEGERKQRTATVVKTRGKNLHERTKTDTKICQKTSTLNR